MSESPVMALNLLKEDEDNPKAYTHLSLMNNETGNGTKIPLLRDEQGYFTVAPVTPRAAIRCPIYIDKENSFVELFNPITGSYMRSGELTEEGIDTGVDPFQRNYPQLLDVGIMGSCIHGRRGLCRQAGVDCYQNGLGCREDHITLENFKKIVEESKGRVFQIALGGRGDPNKHPQFKEICECCRENGIVPNYTTSGLMLTDEEVETTKKLTGAVAVSFYGEQKRLKIRRKKKN